MPNEITLRVEPAPHGRFSVRDGTHLLGTSENEMLAVYSAISVAEEMARSGQQVRVVRVSGGREVEEFVTPKR